MAEENKDIAPKELYDTTAYFHVGVISGAHALKGELRVFPTTDDPERFTAGLTVYLHREKRHVSESVEKTGTGGRFAGMERNDAVRSPGNTSPGSGRRALREGGVEEYTIAHARVHGKFVLVKFRQVDRVEDAELLTGCDIYVSREDAIELEEGEYFVADLIGLSIEDEDGQEIGTLKDVISAPANDVYVMKHHETGKEVLLPAIKQCILNVDLERCVMTVHLLDGLLEL